jgi:hypothetical protein
MIPITKCSMCAITTGVLHPEVIGKFRIAYFCTSCKNKLNAVGGQSLRFPVSQRVTMSTRVRSPEDILDPLVDEVLAIISS